MNEIESLREEIERQLLLMERYKKDVDEVRQKGTACDIARAASGLHDRADELLKYDVIERTLADLGHADFTFTSSNYVPDDVNKTLGLLHGKTVKRCQVGLGLDILVFFSSIWPGLWLVNLACLGNVLSNAD